MDAKTISDPRSQDVCSSNESTTDFTMEEPLPSCESETRTMERGPLSGRGPEVEAALFSISEQAPPAEETSVSEKMKTDTELPVCPNPEESLRLAREGNPEFVYEKLYLPSTMKEIPSFKCWKCPTSVDRMDRLEFHYLSHGAQKKYKCKFCDFSGDQMYVILRHEERHRAQKQTKPTAKEEAPSSPVVSPHSNTGQSAPPRPRISSGTQSGAKEPSCLPIQNLATDAEEEAMEDSEVDSGEEFEVGIESGEEMEIDVGIDDDEVKIVPVDNHSPGLSQALTISPSNLSKNSAGNCKFPSKGPFPIGSNIQSQQKNSNATWKCEFCPEVFKFRSLKKRHEFSHTLNGTYACNQCTYTSKTLLSLNYHKRVHDDRQSERSSSPAPSEGSTTSVTLRERSCRSRSTSSPNLMDEEFERARIGNPEFNYEWQNRKSGGTYKCFICPSSYFALRELDRHVLRHGATDGIYSCRVCNFNNSVKPTFLNHLERHRTQGNISSHLLIFEGTQNKPKGGVDIGDAEEVSLIGNENDFEIEYDVPNDEESQSESDTTEKEPEKFPSPPQLSPRESPTSKIAAKCQPKISTSNTKSIDMYDLNSSSLFSRKTVRPEAYLLSSMKLTNFMCFDEISFNLNSDAITFSGGEGKSTSIISILLCLGYDILLEDYTPKVICGWEISDLIRRGCEVAKMEITLCLKSYPSLREEFGEELKITRTLRRGVALSNTTFQLTSGRDTTDGSESCKIVSLQTFRRILKDLGILPLFAHILLLDRQNLKAVMNERERWYEYFLHAVSSKGNCLKVDLEKLTPIFKRLEGDIKWRKTQLKFLKKQLMIDYPVEEDPVFIQWRSEDVRTLRQVERELEELRQKHNNLEKMTESHGEQLASVPSIVLREMRTIYLEFLASQNCLGDILLDEKQKSLRIWLREKSSSEVDIPLTSDETDNLWGKTPQGKRQLGIFGLYLAFWKVNDTCPFFAVDAFSSAELEFKFPTKGLPVLMRLVRSKSGQQFLMSYPES